MVEITKITGFDSQSQTCCLAHTGYFVSCRQDLLKIKFNRLPLKRIWENISLNNPLQQSSLNPTEVSRKAFTKFKELNITNPVKPLIIPKGIIPVILATRRNQLPLPILPLKADSHLYWMYMFKISQLIS